MSILPQHTGKFCLPMMILVFLAIGTVSASENLTDEISLDDESSAQGIEILYLLQIKNCKI